MTGILDCALAFFAAAGLFWLFWLLFGRLLFPGPNPRAGLTVLPLRGDAETLEQTVSLLLWLHSTRRLSFSIVLVDLGLSPLGQARVSHLMAREPRLYLCSPEGISSFLQRDE